MHAILRNQIKEQDNTTKIKYIEILHNEMLEIKLQQTKMYNPIDELKHILFKKERINEMEDRIKEITRIRVKEIKRWKIG